MSKTILITGATDGIGLATATMLAAKGHRVLAHGRNPSKLEQLQRTLSETRGAAPCETFAADLSRMSDVEALATAVTEAHAHLDVLINNAGVLNAAQTSTEDGLDVRFVVNTIAPYLLTTRLLSRLGPGGRVVNLSSAAQAPVDLDALAGPPRLTDFEAYAQSKLAITSWSRSLAQSLGDDGPMIVAVNPGSLLATKMVKQAFGAPRAGVEVGAEILVRAALSDDFATASGKYYDNDAGRFGSPHADALDPARAKALQHALETVLARISAKSPG